MTDRRHKLNGILSSISIYFFPLLLCLLIMQTGCSSEGSKAVAGPPGVTEEPPPDVEDPKPLPPDEFEQGDWKSLPANPEPPSDSEQAKLQFLENSNQIRQAYIQLKINDEAAEEIQVQLLPLQQNLSQLETEKISSRSTNIQFRS